MRQSPAWTVVVRPAQQRVKDLQSRLGQLGFILASVKYPPGKWIVLQSLRSTTPVRRFDNLDQLDAFTQSLEVGQP